MKTLPCFAGLLLALGTATAGAQSSGDVFKAPSRPTKRPSPQVTGNDCPKAVPPLTSGSVATASDFVELKRTPCASGCPAYTVRVEGDGAVTWTGLSGVSVTGPARGAIASDAARALMQRIADHNYWALCGSYTTFGNADGEIITTLSIAGHAKQVEDDGNVAPSWLRGADLEIDRVADTHMWRHGGPTDETFGVARVIEDALLPKSGVTQLMRAAADRNGTAELEKTLLLLTDVNARDSSGWTALMYAAQSGTLEGMRLLWRAGALADLRSNDGETALFAAVTATVGPEARIVLLRALGVDVNATDLHGVTPLMIAATVAGRQTHVMQTLLQMGADPSKRDDKGRTAADYLKAEMSRKTEPDAAVPAATKRH